MSLQSNHTQEFVALLTGYQSAVRCFIISMMPGSDEVEDVLQDTNIVIWEKMNTFEMGSDFRAWVFTIAKHVTLEHLRKTKRDHAPTFDPALISMIAESWHDGESKVDSAREIALDRCLEGLNEKEQAIVEARYHKGSSLESHSADCGRPAGALRVSLYRIRAKLRRCVKKRLAMKGRGE